VPECKMLNEKQMEYVLKNESIKAVQARQKILFFTLQRFDIQVTDVRHGKMMLEKQMAVIVS
jgi:hypothetical protein